jgi:pilus assembly protein CpaE
MSKDFISVRIESNNPSTRKALEEILTSVNGYELQKPEELDSPDLLILEIGEELQKEFLLIHSIMNRGEVKDVFVTSSRTEPEVIIQALRSGVKEFFTQPLNKEEVQAALEKFRDKTIKPILSRSRGKIIDLVGSKGGVGTTTIAVNLATSLHELEGSPSVALLDINPLLGELPLFLDIKTYFDWGELVKNINRVDSTFLMSIMAKHSSGIYVLPGATVLDGVIATAEVIEKLLDLLQTTFDYIVIDSGKHLNNTSLKILRSADKVLVVSILDLPCLTNTRRLLKIFQDLGFPKRERTEVVVNRLQKKSMITIEEAEKSLNRKIFWSFPNDYQITMSAINQGKPLSTIDPKAELAKRIRGLSSQLAGKSEKR